jgi:hypothetical protein
LVSNNARYTSSGTAPHLHVIIHIMAYGWQGWTIEPLTGLIGSNKKTGKKTTLSPFQVLTNQ